MKKTATSTTVNNIKNVTFSTDAVPVWASEQYLGVDQTTYDILANRRKLSFRFDVFHRACQALGINHVWIQSIHHGRVLMIKEIQDMLDLFGQDMREHFLKVYSAYYFGAD